MITAQTNVDTPWAPEDVYAYLADLANDADWRFDVLASQLLSGRPGQTGARYRQRVKPGRKAMTSHIELTQAEPHHTIRFRTLDDGPVSVAGVYRIDRAASGAHVRCDVALTTRGLARLFEPFMGPSLRRTARRYEHALLEQLSGPAVAAEEARVS